MKDLSEKIQKDIKMILKEMPSTELDKAVLEELIQRLVDISIKLSLNMKDIDSSSKEFQNFLYSKID